MSKLNKFIVDKNGQWAHPGEPTMIPDAGGRITMQGVPYPVYGIDDQGNAITMMPGGEYQFPGNNVYEIPMAQAGGDISIPDLSNKGWLSKYQDGAQVGPRISSLPVQVNTPKPNLGITLDQIKAAEKAKEVYEKINRVVPEKKEVKKITASEMEAINRELKSVNKSTSVPESTATTSAITSQNQQADIFETFVKHKPNLKPNRATMPDFEESIGKYMPPEEKQKRELGEKYYKQYKPETKDEVKQIQQQLIADGFLDNKKNADGSYKELDGKFGDRTKLAYEKYLTKTFSKKGLDLSNELTRKECGLEGCAEYVSSVTKPYAWALGDAWTMNNYINNHGGKTKYNIYNDPAFENVKTANQLKKVTEQVKSKNKASAGMFEIGDVVGLYYPDSKYHQVALEEGKGTKNTHVGVVTSIKDGVPIISHNIHGTLHHEPYKSLNIGWVSSPSPDKVYQPSQKVDDVKDKINIYAKDLVGVFAPDMDPDDVARTVKGILTKETALGKTRPNNQGLRETIRYVRGESTDPADISRGIGKLKTSGLPKKVKDFLQIPDDGSISDDAGIKGAVYKYIEATKFFEDYSKKNPNLKLTAEDVKQLAILSYNQGYDKLSKLGYNNPNMRPEEEVEKLRELYDGNVRDISSTNLKYIQDYIPEFQFFGNDIDVGQMLYDSEYPAGHPSYNKKVNEYSNKQSGGSVSWLQKYQTGAQVPREKQLGPRAEYLPKEEFAAKPNLPDPNIKQFTPEEIAVQQGYKLTLVPGGSGSMKYVYKEPKTGNIFEPESTKRQQTEIADIARSNNVDPIGMAILAGSGVAPLVRTAAAALPYLNAPLTVGSTAIPGVTAGNILGAAGAANSVNQIVNPNSDLRTNPNAVNIAETALGFVGLPYKTAAASVMDDVTKAGEYLTTQTPLNNVYKLNPKAKGSLFNPLETDFHYGYLDQMAYDNALKNFKVRPDLQKNTTSKYFTQSKQPLVGNKESLPVEIEDVDNIYAAKPDWLKGYQRVYQSPKNFDFDNFEVGKNIAESGAFNRGVFELPEYPNYLVKYERPSDMVQYIPEFENMNMAEMQKGLSSPNVGKIIKQHTISPPGEKNINAYLMRRMYGEPFVDLDIKQVQSIPKEAWLQYAKDYTELAKNNLAIDNLGSNVFYDRANKSFKFIDLSPGVTPQMDEFWSNNVIGNVGSTNLPKERTAELIRNGILGQIERNTQQNVFKAAKQIDKNMSLDDASKYIDNLDLHGTIIKNAVKRRLMKEGFKEGGWIEKYQEEDSYKKGGSTNKNKYINNVPLKSSSWLNKYQ